MARLGQNEGPKFDDLTESVTERLALNKPVRRNLPAGGRLRMDRQLPFLCVYRKPSGRKDPGTRELVTTEAAYVFVSGAAEHREGVSRICSGIAATMLEHFGGFLLLEFWTQSLLPEEELALPPRPAFRVITENHREGGEEATRYAEELTKIRIGRRDAQVDQLCQDVVAPPGMPPIELSLRAGDSTWQRIGVAVEPCFRNHSSGVIYPLLLQALRRQLSVATRKTVACFAGGSGEDAAEHPHYQSFGPSSMVQAVRTVDWQLCEVAESFDFLLQVTPTNADSAWEEFKSSGYERAPLFHYRPLPYDPSILKRALFDIPVERIEDATLGHLFWEKQQELDRQLSALRDIETRSFLYGSLQLYGRPDASLVELARGLLRRLRPPRNDERGSDADGEDDESEDDAASGVAAAEAVQRASEEIESYRRVYDKFDATVEVCDTIASGIMVSGSRLMIASSMVLPRHRLDALLHHEIGVHLVTYINGKSQPFGQLYAGLAGYESLQEGLAVLAEYLTGGLTASRVRSLASRVVAVDSLCNGAEFIETFRLLDQEHGLSRRLAFRTTLRAFRAGGLTKDAIYLGGLRNLLRHLGKEHEIEPFFVGKIALRHIPYIQELRRRGIVSPPAVLPHFLNDEHARKRLAECRGATIEQLCSGIQL